MHCPLASANVQPSTVENSAYWHPASFWQLMQQSYGVAALTGKVPSTSATTVVMAWLLTVEMPLLQTETEVEGGEEELGGY